MNIQIYVLKRNFDVQKAERFFKERRVPYQLVDLKKHRLGLREVQLFARCAGARELVDRQNIAALSHPVAHTDDGERITEYLTEHPEFLRTPIVRNGTQVTVGVDEEAWKKWCGAAG
ncbi:MAG: ArsC family transcriptional regulator [Clostridiales bacterium]|nr:ArsC family transcriptional regulator [Clostridiales bacterium]